jgi:hypothetical protein
MSDKHMKIEYLDRGYYRVSGIFCGVCIFGFGHGIREAVEDMLWWYSVSK